MQLTIPIPERQQGVRLPAGLLNWSEEEFFQFCQANHDLQIERTMKGEIVVMSPAGGYSGYRNVEIVRQLSTWAQRDNTGVVFDSSTGFLLPNGGMRSPDAAWVQLSRLKKLTHREKERFIPLCPDFVIEVASPSDDASSLTEKMDEYRQAGLRLGWLILPASVEVEIYVASALKVLKSPETLAGDPVLPGFTLQLGAIWNPPF
ncbi:MAG: Uma2 family endonuclease [Terriglobia bacterium]